MIAEILGFFVTKNKSPVGRKKRPKNWSITTEELFQELNDAKRKEIKQYEIFWAKEYERTLYPPNTMYPQKGNVYEAIEDQEITYLTAWDAPFTGSGKGKIKKGERIWIDNDPIEDKPTGTYAVPVNYSELENRMVPEEERKDQKYSGFYFNISTPVLNSKFMLIEKNHIIKTEER